MEFKEYDHWEKFNPFKSYDDGTYEANYGQGFRRYVWVSYYFTENYNRSRQRPAYMVAQLYFLKEDIQRLAPYCRCYACVTQEDTSCCGVYPLKYLLLFFKPSYGCLKYNNDNPPEHILHRTFRYVKEKEKIK